MAAPLRRSCHGGTPEETLPWRYLCGGAVRALPLPAVALPRRRYCCHGAASHSRGAYQELDREPILEELTDLVAQVEAGIEFDGSRGGALQGKAFLKSASEDIPRLTHRAHRGDPA